MNKNENNDMLSFEDLRRQLGMEGETEESKPAETMKKTTKKEASSVSSENDIAADIEKALENAEAEASAPEIITENGKKFVDITAQYVDKNKKPAEEATQQPVPKKKVRTFNEIFSDFFKNFAPLKKDSRKEKIRKIVMDISIVTIVCCAVSFSHLYIQHREQLKEEETLKSGLIDTDSLDQNQYDEAWEEIFARYPNIETPVGMNLKYAYLYAVNQDLAGWIKIKNTNLDVQVVQTDNNDTYLKKDFYGKKSRYGCPYIDFRNDPKYLDDNTIVYGHHMSDGLMFSNLDKYKTLEGYKESPVIQFDTLYDTYYFKVFAAFVTNSQAKDDDGYIFNYAITDFPTDTRFNGFIDNIKQRSIFDSGITVQPDDKLITLVTCSYEFGQARLVVMGRMLREGEDLTVDTSKASLNTSPRYPQAWYSAKGLENPYADAEKWTP